MEEAGTIALDGIFGGVRIGDEAPLMVWASGDHQGIPNRIMTEELLDEAVEHIPEEAHLRTAWYWAIMVMVHGKLCVDGLLDVWKVEIVEDV